MCVCVCVCVCENIFYYMFRPYMDHNQGQTVHYVHLNNIKYHKILKVK